MKRLVLNHKWFLLIFVAVLLTYGMSDISYGDDEKAVELVGELDCSENEHTAGDVYKITVSGTIRAVRNVRFLTIEAYIDGEWLGIDLIGELSAGSTASFSIQGLHRVTGGTYSCSAEAEWLEELVQTETDDQTDDEQSPESQDFCSVGDILSPGDSCIDPGTGDTFSVLTNGSGRYLFITSGSSIDLQGTINGVARNFIANNRGDGTWEIESVTPGGTIPSDLVVEQPIVSKSTLTPGENFTLSATVRNAGAGSAAATTLRYYRSADATISSSDTGVGTNSVSSLSANQTSDESIPLTAPTSAGTYYYGACVDSVADESQSGNNCSAAVSITVERSPTELVKLSGDNQSGVIGEVLSSPFVVEVRDQDGTPLERVTVMFAVTGGGGMLSATTATTDSAGLAETTLTLGSTPGANTVLATVEGVTQGVTFNAMGEGIEFDLSVSAGTNLIHVPLKVTAVDGAAKTIDTIADLYDALGGANAVNYLITYDPSTQEWLSYFSPADRDTTANQVLTDEMGILASMKAPTTVRLRGDALGTAGSSVIGLTPGLNLVGLPLKDPQIARVSDLLVLDGIRGNVPAIILADDGAFQSVGRADDPADIDITGGQGFLLIAQQAATVTLSGEAWSNVSATAAAPQMLTGIEVGNTTPVLALRGEIVDEVSPVNRSGFRVAVENLLTPWATAHSANIAVNGGDGVGYRLTVVDIKTARAAQVGDVLEISAQSPNPFVRVNPLRHTVTTEDVKRGLIRLPELVAYEMPRETQLLANYPNPFNPETWIPYRLAEDAFVTLTIYDGNGQVIRILEVGHQIAAVYESRAKAIYWDGRNNLGETVASGIYFYHLSAGDYSRSRKMLILK